MTGFVPLAEDLVEALVGDRLSTVERDQERVLERAEARRDRIR
jgi:hypothetical protein